ncbi:MAG: hypothetical protein ACTSSE_16660 [Candidatus Thorarchaeota archaeon]
MSELELLILKSIAYLGFVVGMLVIYALYNMRSTIEELKLYCWSLLPDLPRDISERDYWGTHPRRKEVNSKHG